MASKAVMQDITDAGFSAMQFGSPPTWATAGSGLVALLLTRASNWAAQRVTATLYAAATAGYVFDCLVNAEIAYVSQILWTRRAAFLDQSATTALSDNDRAAQLKQFLANASSADCDADYWIAEAMRSLGLDPATILDGTGLSSGFIENGHFPQISTTALNAGDAP